VTLIVLQSTQKCDSVVLGGLNARYHFEIYLLPSPYTLYADPVFFWIGLPIGLISPA
jgi:hypothetical protein